MHELLDRSILGIFSILFYLFTLFILWRVSYRCYENYIIKRKTESHLNLKISIVSTFLFSLVYALFNKFLTEHALHDGLGGDRSNYRQDFFGRDTGYIGYDFYDELVHKFTEDFNLFMYFTTFICCVTIFIVYNLHRRTTPKNLLVLMLTPIVFFTFTGYKQCMSSNFVMLFFAVMSYENSRKRDVLAIVCIILACLFHSSAYMLIPIYFLIRKYRTYNLGIFIVALIGIFLFLEPICRQIAGSTSSVFPVLSNKLLDYFSEESTHRDDGTLVTIIKGFPYYYLSIIGITKRKKLSEKIKSYDTYLMLIIIAAFSYAAAGISYWLSRLTALFYLPVSIFAVILFENEEDRRISFYDRFIFIGSLAFFTFRSVFLTFYNWGGY